MKFYLAVFLISIFGFAVFGQQTDKTTPPDERRILSFPKPEKMFEILEGKWIFADMACAEPYKVTISADRKSIKFQYAKPQKSKDGTEHDSFTYKVLEVGGYFIRTQIESELRKTDDGNIVVWDFIFLTPDEFVWHRTDWEGLNSTTSVTRCKEDKVRIFSEADGSANSVRLKVVEPLEYKNSISGGVLNGKAVTLGKPKYPAAASYVRVSGTVNMLVTIDEQGNIISASAISGHPLLGQETEQAALASKFEPTVLAGRPVHVTGIIVYNFVP